MRIITRQARLRLAILALLLAGLAVGGWRSMIRMPLQSYSGPWSPLNPEETALRDALKRDVETLGASIGERNVFRPKQLQAAAELIERSFKSGGLNVDRLGYEMDHEQYFNIQAVIPGAARAAEVIVIGAHYDSVLGSPGANDNGSGVAAVLALARHFSGEKPARALRFVAFVNEEPPFFQTRNMGSLVYARQCRERGDNIVAMLSLETIGCYSEKENSQHYPFPVGLFYPSKANFIAFVGNTASRRLVRQCVESFRRQVEFPSEGAALPGWIMGVGWSDHWAFWQEGYPGVMVTDTALFRYAHYHSDEDTPEKLDYDRMARVVSGLIKVVEELANP